MEKVSGIYCIQNIVNDKMYIGSSFDVFKRKYNHFNYLKNNRHPNNHLQKSFNKYGEGKFHFYIVEKIKNPSPNELSDTEDNYIEITQSNKREFGYNIKEACTRKHSQETKNKISLANTGKKRSEESKKKMSESHIGKSYGHGNTSKRSEKHIKILRECNIGNKYNVGRIISEETRNKMIHSQKQRRLKEKQCQ